MILQQLLLIETVSVVYLTVIVSFSVFLKIPSFLYWWVFFPFWNVLWSCMAVPYLQVTRIFVYSFIFPCYYDRPLFWFTASLMLVLHQQFLWLQEHCFTCCQMVLWCYCRWSLQKFISLIFILFSCSLWLCSFTMKCWIFTGCSKAHNHNSYIFFFFIVYQISSLLI